MEGRMIIRVEQQKNLVGKLIGEATHAQFGLTIVEPVKVQFRH